MWKYAVLALTQSAIRICEHNVPVSEYSSLIPGCQHAVMVQLAYLLLPIRVRLYTKYKVYEW